MVKLIAQILFAHFKADWFCIKKMIFSRELWRVVTIEADEPMKTYAICALKDSDSSLKVFWERRF